MLFDPVPEPKTVKNRMHWDVYGDVAELVGRGATVLDEQPRWTVLADPEGNEFCVFPSAGWERGTSVSKPGEWFRDARCGSLSRC